ncbi:hypothetical protein [Methylorubrum suomiense]|uniref:Uncharacterized protein n=1 Tax=Methylorubrum suomiense TaxID=144191 RepID=A0ABQ4UYC9_9HYPH|nr:hypothetical protein [Methylorubrum suomiense]GJE77196.1 hypothetical protein BGCPKDLD_3799 [Methylorubrum suomiense]
MTSANGEAVASEQSFTDDLGTLRKFDPLSAIDELREAGPDGGDLMGFYCRGHVARYDFAEACNKQTGANLEYDVRFVRPLEARHEWWRTVPLGGADGYSQFISAEPGSRGAYKVTVWDGVSRARRYGMRDYISADRHGHRRGFAEGFNYALKHLGIRHRDAEEHLLKVWHGRGAADADKQSEA